MEPFRYAWKLWILVTGIVGTRVTLNWMINEFQGHCDRKIAECRRILDELREDDDRTDLA